MAHACFFLENVALVLHMLGACGVQQTRGKMQSADRRHFLLNRANRVTRALFRLRVLCNSNSPKCSTILRLTGVQIFTMIFVNNPVYA